MPSVLVKKSLLSSVIHCMMSATTSEDVVNKSLVRVDFKRLRRSVGSDEDFKMS